MIGQEEEGVQSTGQESVVLGATLLFGKSYGVHARDPGERGTPGEAKVVGESQEKTFVIFVILKKSCALFGKMFKVIDVTGLKIAK